MVRLKTRERSHSQSIAFEPNPGHGLGVPASSVHVRHPSFSKIPVRSLDSEQRKALTGMLPCPKTSYTCQQSDVESLSEKWSAW